MAAPDPTPPARPADRDPGPAVPTRVPLAMVGAIGEQLAATASTLQAGGGATPVQLARLERWGLQLQELVHVVSRAGRLRRERVDLGLALLQTLAEWSAEANRAGVDLHGPACSVDVDANPAALKHLLDLLVEHGLQQGRSLRLDIESGDDSPEVRVVALADAAPASSSPARETLAWQLLLLLAHALALAPERAAVPGGERMVLPLPRAPAAP